MTFCVFFAILLVGITFKKHKSEGGGFVNFARKIKSGISLMIASAMLFSFTGCEFGKAKQESSTVSQAEGTNITNVEANVNDIDDAFVELNIQPLVVNWNCQEMCSRRKPKI